MHRYRILFLPVAFFSVMLSASPGQANPIGATIEDVANAKALRFAQLMHPDNDECATCGVVAANALALPPLPTSLPLKVDVPLVQDAGAPPKVFSPPVFALDKSGSSTSAVDGPVVAADDDVPEPAVWPVVIVALLSLLSVVALRRRSTPR